MYSPKERLKQSYFIKENYNRIRKILLHLTAGRFYQAFKVSLHYNPVYRLVASTRAYKKMRRKPVFKKALRLFLDGNNQKKIRKFNIALVLKEGDVLPQSSAFIRLVAPLTHPSVSGQISIRLFSAKKPRVNSENNIYVVQRTAFDNLKKARKFVGQVKEQGAKLIVDNDDAFFQISEDHPEYNIHNQRLGAVEYLLAQADQIWLSTNGLLIERFKNKSTIIPNGLDERIWKTKGQKNNTGTGAKIKMLYMGTATHDADLQTILPALDNVHKNYPDTFSLSVIGVSPNLPQRGWIKRLDVPKYMSIYPLFVKWYLNQGPFDIGLSPLVDNDFNQSKSDIKCLDYLAAGMLPVVSNILPYQTKEIEEFIIKVDNQHDAWLKTLSDIVANPREFRSEKNKKVSSARKYIWTKRSSETSAKKMLSQLEQLIKN